MGSETSKAHARRLREGYFDTVFVGRGIDIGCGDDPVTPDCLHWDLPQGDAQELPGLAPESFDRFCSSHCLEHLPSPWKALLRWWEVLRPSGWLLVVVPDEDLYEQGCWPSRFNPDHRWSFTAHKNRSWSPVSLNLADLAAAPPAPPPAVDPHLRRRLRPLPGSLGPRRRPRRGSPRVPRPQSCGGEW